MCERCGAEAPQWVGKCPSCGEWNTLVEFRVPSGGAPAAARRPSAQGAGPASAATLAAALESGDPRGARLLTGLEELDRVLGAGLVPGSLVLVAGDPGVGKSTLLLQAANSFALIHGPCLYVSGEESPTQVAMRGRRLGRLSSDLLLLAETDVLAIEEEVKRTSPRLVVVDSIQAVYSPETQSPPGTLSQVRECAVRLLRVAKDLDVPTFLVGHVTKEGAIAGPRVLEHMVDTVLSLEGDRHSGYRVLRGVKNRFGSTDELGLFQMTEAGLEGVPDASAALLAERRGGVPGSSVVAALEGNRPLLVEVQALVTRAAPYATPRRSVTGLDFNRACLVMGVLEKRVGIPLSAADIYVNVPGGIRVAEPAADLGLALALASSFNEAAIDPSAACLGEVGLGGEIRPVTRLERRLAELARHGFQRCLVPPQTKGSARTEASAPAGMTLVRVDTVGEALAAAFAPKR